MNEQLNTDTDNTDTDKGKPLIHFVEKDDLNKPSAITLCGITLTRPPIPKSKMKKHKYCEPCLVLLELDKSLKS